MKKEKEKKILLKNKNYKKQELKFEIVGHSNLGKKKNCKEN